MFESLRSAGTVLRRFVALLPVLIAVTTLPIALLALFNAGVVEAFQVAIVGWLLLTPVVAIIAWIVLDLSPVALPWGLGDRGVDLPGVADRARSGNSADPDTDDPVELLRERFARGEIEQAEFERRLDQLLATEGVSAGGRDDRVRRSPSASEAGTDRETASNEIDGSPSRAGGSPSRDGDPPARQERESPTRRKRESPARRDREPESS